MPEAAKRVFVMRDVDGKEVRIKAARFYHYETSDGREWYHFYSTEEDRLPDAVIDGQFIANVIAQDMLFSTFEDGSLLSDIISDEPNKTNFLHDALFSDADKGVPFSPPERETIVKALKDVEQRISEKFKPNEEQLSDIHQKLDYLSRKVASLDRFSWKRVLVTTIVGVSVDLGFGTLIPGAILTLFKEVLSHFLMKVLPCGGS